MNHFVVIIFITSVLFPVVFPFFKEGKEAELIFQYEFDEEVDFSLFKGNSRPFYEEGHLVNTALTESQLNRFNVTTDFKKSIPLLIIQLTIAEVKREEAGTYVCNINRSHEIQKEFTKRISLKVDFPPGKASCAIRSSSHVIYPDEEWALLSCSALPGRYLSFIQCYQKEVVALPWQEPFRNTTTIVHTFWIRKSERVFCCSSAHHEVAIKRVNCKDYVWEPTLMNLTDQVPGSLTTGEIQTNRPGAPSFTETTSQNSVPTRENDDVDRSVYVIAAMVTILAILIPMIYQLKIISNQIRNFQISFDKNKDESAKKGETPADNNTNNQDQAK